MFFIRRLVGITVVRTVTKQLKPVTGQLQQDTAHAVSANHKGEQVGHKASDSDVVPFREALNMEIIINQALIDILIAKGIFTQEELMEKIGAIRKEMPVTSS